MINPRYLHRQGARRALPASPGLPWWLPVLICLSLTGSAFAQYVPSPTGAPEAAPGPMPSPPLGAGAGTQAATPRITPPRVPTAAEIESDSPSSRTALPHVPTAAEVEADNPLPAGANGTNGASPVLDSEGNAQLFGTGGGGKAVVPGFTRQVPYSFSLSVSGTYDDNTSLRRGRTGGDFYFSISPSFVFGLDNLVSARGNFLHFSYTPIVSLYAISGENDSLQHLLGLDVQYRFGRFLVSARQSVEILDGTDTAQTSPGPGSLLQPGQTAGSPVYTTGTTNQVNLDVSGRSTLNLYDTSLNASFAYSDKTSVSVGIQYAVSAYSDLISSQTLSGSLYADYVYSLKTTVGVGLSGGRTFVDSPSPDQDFLQVNARISYRYSALLSFAGSIGTEFRQSEGRSGIDATPVFELSASYRLTDRTSFTLSGSRTIQVSAVEVGQDFQSTSFSVGMQQTINSRISASLTLGYQNAHYVSELSRISADRDENYFTIQPNININLRPGLALNLFYLHRQSSSSGRDGRSFSNNQAGFSVSYTF